MTLRETTTQIISLSNVLNGEVRSRAWLERYVREMFSPGHGPLKLGDSIAMLIALPDGEWVFTIDRCANSEWGYYIPETREQEQRLWKSLTA